MKHKKKKHRGVDFVGKRVSWESIVGHQLEGVVIDQDTILRVRIGDEIAEVNSKRVRVLIGAAPNEGGAGI
jgi:hypothetical protein